MMTPSHLLAGPSSAATPGSGSSMHRRTSLSPPGGAHMARRPSSLRESSSASDLIQDDDDDEEQEATRKMEGDERRTGRLALPSASASRGKWNPETSPTSSEGSNDSNDSCDFDADHFGSMCGSSSSSSSISVTEEKHGEPSSPIELPPRSRQKTSTLSADKSTMPSLPSPAPALPNRRPPGLTPLSSIAAPPVNSGSTLSLPKAQPLARTLFARMADTPHAGMGLGKKAGKQKLIVATKPMRTTFELGLTSGELARRC